MESNSSNPQTQTADAQENTGGSSDPAWSDTRDLGQHSQTSQTSASMRRDAEDADNLGRTATDATRLPQDAKAKASAAAQTGKAYAQDAVNAAGKKIARMKARPPI